MDSIKIDVAINVPDNIKSDLLKIKAVMEECDNAGSIEELLAVETAHQNIRIDLFNKVVDIIAADEALIHEIKEELRIYIRSL